MVYCLLCTLTTPWQYNIISETWHLNRWSYSLGFPQPHSQLQVIQRKDKVSHRMALQRLVSRHLMVKLFCDPCSNYTRPTEGSYFMIFQANSYTPLCWWMLCDPPVSTPRPGTYYLCVNNSFPSSPWLLLWTWCFLITPSSPEPKISNQASFLKQIIPTIPNISEKDMQEDQDAFLFPWGWLLFESSDSQRQSPGPSDGLLFLSAGFSPGTFGTSRTFCKNSAPHSWQ